MGVPAADKEQALRFAADRERTQRLRKAMFAWINGVQTTQSGLSEVQFDVIRKMARRRLHELMIYILVEAAPKERKRMGSKGRTLP